MKWHCGWNFNDLINCAKGCYENFDNNDNEMRGDISIPMFMYISLLLYSMYVYGTYGMGMNIF